MTAHPRCSEIAGMLAHALETATACDAPSTLEPELSLADAYAIQQELLITRQTHGDVLRGHKIGLTSAAVQQWLGVNEPDYGGLLASMALPEGGELSRSTLIAPRVEGELAFVLDHPLEGPGITAAEVLSATAYVLPCIEVIDSRVRDWKITIVDTVADNASSSRYVLGHEPLSPADIDMRLVGMRLEKRGDVVSTGAGVACLGSPVNAVVWLANTLGRLGTRLEAGQVILSGALGPVTPVEAGDWVRLQIGQSSAVTLRIVD